MRILCSTALKGVMPMIVQQYAAPDAEIKIDFGTTLELVEQCKTTSNVDAIIVTESGIKNLLEHQQIENSSIRTIAKTGIGIAIAKGAKHYDISTPEHFKQTLIDCQSIAFTQRGASGMFFAKLLQTLGLEEIVLPKAIRPEGGLVASLVENQSVELAVQLVSEIKAVPGVDLLGLIPQAYQDWNVFQIARTIHAQNNTTDAFIAWLSNPALQKQIEPFGFFS
jgi:molybdate transport system substrate-binding protein